jgi:S-phase kinase-associated protein 1
MSNLFACRDHPSPEIEKPLRSNNLSDVTTPWYAEFMNVDQEMLFELILAAD